MAKPKFGQQIVRLVAIPNLPTYGQPIVVKAAE